MVKVKSKGKTYQLNKADFQKYMFSLWKAAQARKQAKIDFQQEKGKTA